MKGKKVAIAGSGPAGMTAATKLASAGFKVKVFEKLPLFGGIPAYCIPEFRMPIQSIKKRVEIAGREGIEFIRKDVVSVKALLDDFDFVLLAIGAGETAEIGIDWGKINGIIKATDFLYAKKVDKKAMVGKGEKVAVIGGGNCAIDAARTAARQGGKATIIYRRTEKEMPAYNTEIEAAKREAVLFEFLLSPIKFVGKDKLNKIRLAKMQLSNPDETGRRRPIPTGKVIEKPFDKAIIAIGQNQNLGWLEKDGIETIDGWKIKVDENYKTSLPRVYAAGDCVTGAKTIAEATRTGRGAADGIIEFVGKKTS